MNISKMTTLQRLIEFYNKQSSYDKTYNKLITQFWIINEDNISLKDLLYPKPDEDTTTMSRNEVINKLNQILSYDEEFNTLQFSHKRSIEYCLGVLKERTDIGILILHNISFYRRNAFIATVINNSLDYL